MPSPSPRSSQPKRARRKEARPGELLDAALDLFVEKGFAATRSEEVAARAGVSKGTLFLYFPTKQDLFKAVVHESLATRFVAWNAEYESFTGSTAEMLRYCLDTWWTHVGKTKASGISKLIMTEAHNFPEVAAYYQAKVIAPAAVLVRRILQRGIDRGEFEPVDLDYAVFSILGTFAYIIAWKHSMVTCLPPGTPFEPERYLASQADIILNGLQRRAA